MVIFSYLKEINLSASFGASKLADKLKHLTQAQTTTDSTIKQTLPPLPKTRLNHELLSLIFLILPSSAKFSNS
jgi:hypothetical protein